MGLVCEEGRPRSLILLEKGCEESCSKWIVESDCEEKKSSGIEVNHCTQNKRRSARLTQGRNVGELLKETEHVHKVFL